MRISSTKIRNAGLYICIVPKDTYGRVNKGNKLCSL